jgi:hypothetical protein
MAAADPAAHNGEQVLCYAFAVGAVNA